MSNKDIQKSEYFPNNKINLNESSLTIYNDNNTTTNLPIESETTPDKLEIIEENLMFDYKPVSPFKLYYYISGKYEIFLMIIATLLTIGAGCSNALKSSLLGDAINNLASTGYTKNMTNEEFNTLMDHIEPQINKTIKQFLIYGSIMFVLNFLSEFLWLYSGFRQIHNLKINYFSLILRQEQGWFDKNNVYEFATKIQAQLDGIEQGIGDRLGTIILRLIEIISGYIIGFTTSWKLTLILSACSIPFIIAGHLIMRYGLEKEKILSIKMQEKAGGIVEELLYNIRTITSFANFDYEIKRFDEAFKSQSSPKKLITISMVFGLVLFGINFVIAIGSIYARQFIEKKIIDPGKITKVFLSLYGSFMSMFWLFPSIILFRNSCISSSDYFYLYERIPEIHISKENLKPDRKSIKGNIEFKNVKFYYPSDKTKKLILNGFNA